MSAMIRYRRRRLELLLLVRRAERDGLVRIPDRRPPDRRRDVAVRARVAPAAMRGMTADSGRGGWRYVQGEQSRHLSRGQQ
jgi:hypothetical protein